MSSWGALERELEAWQADGLVLSFWWRDDDACEDTGALQRLLGLAADHGVPLALAAIPARLQPSLIRAMAAAPGAAVLLQHGYAHANHAPAGAKKMELCARPFGSDDFRAAADDLVKGAALLAAAFDGAPAPQRLPVVVPPWNRIDPGLIARLPKLGFHGLSTFGPHTPAGNTEVIQINCHLDIFQWKPARRFRGEAALLDQVTADLAHRRLRRNTGGEPYGLLTHHLVHDADCWRFLERLLALLRRQAAVTFAAPAILFATALPRQGGEKTAMGEAG